MDPDARAIERSVPGSAQRSIHSDALAWRPDRRIAPLTIDVPALFADLPDPATGSHQPS